MSLNRVPSMESWERGRGQSPVRSPRRMSFNPVSEWVPPKADVKPSVQDAASDNLEVSKGKRIAQVCIAVIYCLLAAGVVFGYAAIKPVLIEEGVYRDRCTDEELEDNISTCYGQEIRLNLMFTIAAVATNICALPVGTILDRFGPRVSGVIGSIFIAIGAVLFAMASNLPFDGYIPGYLFLALGGPFVFISSFQLSNCFPAHSGLILALLTGAFDTSSALFLVFRLLFEATEGRLGTKQLFLMYLIVPVFILIVQVAIMPSRSYKTVGEIVNEAGGDLDAPSPDTDSGLGDDERERLREEMRQHRESVISEITSLLGTSTSSKRAKREDEKNRRSGVWGILHGFSALEQIKTPWWWLITLFTLVQMTRINYFVATIRPQYEYMLRSSNAAKRVNQIFDVALPLGGVLSIPFIGSILDNTSTSFTLLLLVSVATIIGVLGCLPSFPAAVANICLFVVYRPFYYTAVSDYAAKVFGFQTFGKVYGLIICTAGIFNLVQSLLDALTHRAFNRNPLPVNVLLLSIALVVGGALVTFVTVKSRDVKRDLLEEEAQEARESLMPTVNGNGNESVRGYGTGS